MTWSNDGPVILTELRRWALSTYWQKRERINGSDTSSLCHQSCWLKSYKREWFKCTENQWCWSLLISEQHNYTLPVDFQYCKPHCAKWPLPQTSHSPSIQPLSAEWIWVRKVSTITKLVPLAARSSQFQYQRAGDILHSDSLLRREKVMRLKQNALVVGGLRLFFFFF